MMNRRFLTVLGLSALLALVVSGIFYQITTAVRSPRRGRVETSSVVVASNPLALGALIKASDLKVVPWPSANLPPGSFTKVDELVDRVAMGNLVPEEPVLEGKLAARGSGLGLSPIIPPGMRAVSVRVNDVISVSGFVLPGSRVDVMVTGVPHGAGDQGPVTRTVLSNLQVLSAGKNLQPDGKGQPDNVAVVTLLVTPEQAELLMLASSEGKIQLALRNNSDEHLTDGPGVRSAEIFAGPAKAPPPPVRASGTPRPRPPAVPVAVVPPPPPPQIELIKGDRKTIEVISVEHP
jgi:pilus assembly protein CpaB